MKNKYEEKIIYELVEHLKKLRLEKKLSHNKLSIKAGVSRPAISQIEARKRTPTLIVCLKVARALDVKLGDLVAKCEEKIYKE